MPEKRLVFPGDVLAASEELMPGPGTAEVGPNIVATRLGHFDVDPREMAAVVQPLTSVPVELVEGDIVVGEVNMVKSTMIGVTVLRKVGTERWISSETNGTLHVSKIDRRYVHDASREYRLGDALRARVIDTEPSLQLATEDPDHGCIKALCTRCRHDLERKGPRLECPNCGRVETRKLARDYGQGRM